MSWGFGAGYPLHTRPPPPISQSLKKPSLAWDWGRGQQKVDGIQGRAAGTTMDQEEENVGSACNKVSRPHPPPPTQGPVNDKTNSFVGHLISKESSGTPDPVAT